MTLSETVAPAAAGTSDQVLAETLDGARFALFYEAVAPRLWRYLHVSVRDRNQADDLLQETFTRVLGSRLVPESDEHLRRYLYRTATHLLIDRRRRPGPVLESLEDLELGSAGSDSTLRLDLASALGKLKPRDRQVLYLAHIEEMDHRAIGEAMGISAMSVRVLLFRARRRLAAVLESEGSVTRRSVA